MTDLSPSETGEMSAELTANNITQHMEDICEVTDHCEYRDNVISVIILFTVSLLFLLSILINVTIVIIHIKTSSLRTISNR